jgi:NTP pyrophosphatase (non-canonical NTP hydrolase)
MALDVEAVARRLREFAAARDWEQYHSPKNLATALVVEAAELAEIFQWLTIDESLASALDDDTRAHVEEEVADVFIYLVRFADVVGVDLHGVVNAKIDANERRFPPAGPSPATRPERG